MSKDQRASAQSFIAFVTMGVGMFVGSYVGGVTLNQYPSETQIAINKLTKDGKPVPDAPRTTILPAWDPEGKTGIAKELGLKVDSSVTADQIPEEYTEVDAKSGAKTIYNQESFVAALKQADTNNDGSVSRTEWRKAREHGWFHIWLWPALGALATCIVFWIGFKDQRDPEMEKEMAEEAPLGSGEGPEPQVG